MKITLQNKTVNYTLKKSKRARRIRITVYPDTSVVVTVPFTCRDIESFIKEKEKWLLDKISFFQKSKNSPLKRHDYEDYLKHKEKARKIIKERISLLNKRYGYTFNRVSIKNQKTIWGSCSKKGNLNFNYKIIFLPQKLCDYIIVHELCHLKEPNHSSRFWNLVAETFPDYKKIRGDLLLL